MKVSVEFNGVRHEVSVSKIAYAGALKTRAEHHFMPAISYGRLGLWDKHGKELGMNMTLRAQGVANGDVLLMRPLVVALF